MSYAELACTSSYSFLRGASPPSDYVVEGISLNLKAIGIADRNTVSGVVRAWKALRDAPDDARNALLKIKRKRGEPEELTKEEEASCQTDLRFVAGARLVFSDGTPDILAYPATRKGWSNLTRLLTVGNLRAVKGSCILGFEDLLGHSDNLLLIVLTYSTRDKEKEHPHPPEYAFKHSQKGKKDSPRLKLVSKAPQDWNEALRRLVRYKGKDVWLGVSVYHDSKDKRLFASYKQMSVALGVPLLATNDVLYASSQQRPLHDIVTCIRLGTTVQKAGRILKANGERFIKSADQMADLFEFCPQALAETVRFVSRIKFDISKLSYEYPHEPVPKGWRPDAWLACLVWRSANERYGKYIPKKIRKSVKAELAFIRKENIAYYFLTVHDLVKFARDQKPPILCQGRGSAANSTVCFLLGVTSVDPLHNSLLFSRFISSDRSEPPDIDVDFEHKRREDVMQYIYKRYGRHRAAIAATVVHYKPRSALREVGKALGLSEDVISGLSGLVWGSFGSEPDEQRLKVAGFDPDNPEIARLRFLSRQLLQSPRHLSQHVGGYLLTQNRLDETVPVHNAVMDNRTFIEWDKDDIDALRLLKVDVLALGMLTCIRKAYNMMRDNGFGDHDLTIDIDSNDPKVYEMLEKGDSIGVFQVESRAQMSMLPRMKPLSLYDLTIQVAIVRPGPIQGNMVHPYLHRRELERKGETAFEFPKPAPPHDPNELQKILGKTLGVPLFQEQAMQLAITAAEFSDAEANKLRRAMATFRNVGGMENFEEKMVGGMIGRGYEREFAERCFKQIQGFGSYGFPESHALSFARLVYVSAWIKYHYPAIFAASLLNSQPMGFYAPAQIVSMAKGHGVQILPIDVNHSDWDNAVVPDSSAFTKEGLALRLGLRQIEGFTEAWTSAMMAARPFISIKDLARRAQLPSRALHLLADADAVRSLGYDRREGAWEAQRIPPKQLPLFFGMKAEELGEERKVRLPPMRLNEHIAADYQTIRLSLKGHPMQILRPVFVQEGIKSSAEISASKNGALAKVAGVVLVRQRPGEGKAIFVTLEDETGVTNIIMWARTFKRFQLVVMSARLMEVQGEIQRSSEGVVHVMAHRIVDRTVELLKLSELDDTKPMLARANVFASPLLDRRASTVGRHPRDVRMLPKSRDFH